jgi:hypothetical protein
MSRACNVFASGGKIDLFRVRHDRCTDRATMSPAFKGPTRDRRALAIFAKSIYRELRASGYKTEDVIDLASELLERVTADVGAAEKT